VGWAKARNARRAHAPRKYVGTALCAFAHPTLLAVEQGDFPHRRRLTHGRLSPASGWICGIPPLTIPAPGSDAMRTKPCLTEADARQMMTACLAEADKNDWEVTIAIVDDAGVLINLERMDGAPAISAAVAPEKAKASALTKQPTKFWEDRVKERPAFANFPA